MVESIFRVTIIAIIVAIVYPKQKPLYNIIPNTIGIPKYQMKKEENTKLPRAKQTTI